MKGSLLLNNLKLNCLTFFYPSKRLTDYFYTDIYCKLSKCIKQAPCLYEHYHCQYCKASASSNLVVYFQSSCWCIFM